MHAQVHHHSSKKHRDHPRAHQQDFPIPELRTWWELEDEGVVDALLPPRIDIPPIQDEVEQYERQHAGQS